MTVKRTAVIHPYLFGVFPILFLYAQNAGEMRARDLLGPLVVVVSVTAIAMFVSTRASGSKAKAGAAVSTLLLLFFSYGYVLHYLELRTEQLHTMRNHAFVVAQRRFTIFRLCDLESCFRNSSCIFVTVLPPWFEESADCISRFVLSEAVGNHVRELQQHCLVPCNTREQQKSQQEPAP